MFAPSRPFDLAEVNETSTPTSLPLVEQVAVTAPASVTSESSQSLQLHCSNVKASKY